MSRNSFIFLAIIFTLFAISLFIILRPQSTPAPSPIPAVLASQENSGGEVNVKVTPLVLKAGENPQFKIEFNTHSVELNFDVAKIAELIDGSRKINQESIWDGTPPGGHHRSGILTFSAPLPVAKSITLILRDIAGIPKREFIWQL